MHFVIRLCFVLLLPTVVANTAWGQGVPLDTLLRGGPQKPPSTATPSGSAPQATRPATNGRAQEALPFDVQLPQGWNARKTEEGGMLARSAGGDAAVVVLPVLRLQGLNASQWLRQQGARSLARYLPGASLAAIYPSRNSQGSALAALEFQGQSAGKASVMLFTHGDTGTLYAIATAAPRFERERPALMAILRSFSFRGEETSAREKAVIAPSADPAAKLTWKRFQDPAEQAFTVDVPANWQVDGGLVRKSTVDVSTFVRVRSPEGVVVVLGDPDLPKFVLPTETLAWTGFREGSQYSPFPGNVMIVYRYLPGAQYALWHASRIAPQYGLANLQMGQPRPRPDVDQNIPSIGTQVRGGEVEFTAAHNQAPIDGYVMAATSVMTMQGVEGGVWNVQLLITHLAPKGLSPLARAVVARMMGSIRLNPEWVRQQRQLSQETYRAVRETNEYISNLFRESFEERQRIQDRQHREFGDVIRGVVRLRDPETGDVLEGKAGNNYYWRVRNTDTLIGSDLPDAPPNVDVSELEQVR